MPFAHALPQGVNTHENRRAQDLRRRQSAACFRRPLFPLPQAQDRQRNRGRGRGLRGKLRAESDRRDDRGRVRASCRGRRSVPHRGAMAECLRPRLFGPARYLAHGGALGNRNGALGHRRQGGHEARLRAHRRQGPRAAAQLHLPLSRRARLARLLGQSGLLKSARRRGAGAQIHGAGLHCSEVRSGRALFDLRSPPAEPRAARALRSLLQDFARGGRDQMRSSVRHPRPVHRLGRAAHGAADRAL